MNTPVTKRVVANNGLQGKVTDRLQADDGTISVLVAFESGERVRIPESMLVQQDDGSLYALLSQEDLRNSAQQTGNERVIPVMIEEAHVSKRIVETGKVRIRKIVHEEEEIVDEPLFREEISVDRVTINKEVDTPPEVRREGETVIVPVVEEVLVIEKRLMLKEELHITRRQRTEQSHQPVTLRREEVVVERLAPNEREVPEQE